MQLGTVCERVRSDENFLRVVSELRPEDLPPSKPGAAARGDVKTDPKLVSALDGLLGPPSSSLPPITDIVVLYKSEATPEGYTKVRPSRPWLLG